MKSGGKGCVIGAMLLLSTMGVGSNLSAQTQEPVRESNSEWGSLFGYVYDAFMGPIQDATITASCGDFTFMNTSDSSGYYYIGHVPIVDCLWTINASKRGYNTVCVEMPIDENTTLDFILNPLGHIIYVDDIPGEGPGNPPENFTRIQDAIDVASDGDTVFVYNGVYNEYNLICNSSIKLTGQEREKTIINGTDEQGNETFFIMNTTTMTIQNFTFEKIMLTGTDFFLKNSLGKDAAISIDNNMFTNSLFAIVLLYNYLNATVEISNNIILNGSDSTTGILFSTTSASVHIFHNMISGCVIGVIGLGTSNITNNEISHCFYGILPLVQKGNTVHINENTFIQNIKHADFLYECYIGKGNQPFNKLNSFRDFEFLSFYQKNMPLKTSRNKGIITWNHNYWDNWNGIGPKMITGKLAITFPWDLRLPLPWVNFDWHPAKGPYDNGGKTWGK